MQGYNALWLPGMDHAGIATQNVVERELAKEGLSRHDLGREAFVERVWAVEGASPAGAILGQMRRLGDSVDWTRERFTMDAGLSRAVQTIFKRLFDDGLIYRAERIINWCPRCLTALSDIEVEHTDDDGELVSIRYGDGDDRSWWRPPGWRPCSATPPWPCTPTTPATATWSARQIELPLTGRASRSWPTRTSTRSSAPARSRSRPAHDPDDFEIGRRHDLPSLVIMDERARDHRARPVPGPGPVRGPPGRAGARCASRAGSWPSGGRTCTRWGTARAAAPRSSRGCRCSGSSRSSRWPRRPATRCATAGCGSTRRSWPPGTSTGSTTCTTGASAASCGGGTGSRSGTRPTARCVCVGPDEEPPAGDGLGRRTPTCWTPGSPRRCGRSPPSAGRTTPPTCGPSTRPACW